MHRRGKTVAVAQARMQHAELPGLEGNQGLLERADWSMTAAASDAAGSRNEGGEGGKGERENMAPDQPGNKGP